MNVPNDWFQSFFSGLFVDLWLQAVPAGQTRLEADFIREMLQASPPARLLDVPCGGGRHTLALAAAGFRMTGVDLSADCLSAAQARAAEQKVSVTWDQRPMRDLPWHAEFDGACCFGNSFGYDTDEGNAAFVYAVARALKPGARFVLDASSVAEARLPRFQERNWCLIGDIYFLEDEHYDPARGRTDTEYTLIRNGVVERGLGSHRIYTYREIHALLAAAGFMDLESFGNLAREPFRLGSEGLIVVARKGTD